MLFTTETGEPKKWLVTGTRYGRPDLVSALDAVLAGEGRPCLVVVGDCRGVDKAAQGWCLAKGIECLEKRANWSQSKQAGLKRNAMLVAEMRSGDLCIALPHWTGSSGTLHCSKLATRAGLKVIWIEDPRGRDCEG